MSRFNILYRGEASEAADALDQYTADTGELGAALVNALRRIDRLEKVAQSGYGADERGRISAAESAASRWLFDAGYDGASADQCACILDPTRANEARAMIEHWQIRCGLPAHLADAITSLLRRLPPDHPEDIT